MKIQIIGYSGSGKSTLAKELATYFNIPYIHLDNVQFYGDWQIRSIEEQNKIVDEFISENENWIIDGNYSKVSKKRFEISDITIFLNYNRFYCYKKAKKRYKNNKGKSRESCPCIEKFDFAFRIWLLIRGRTIKRKKKHLENLNKTSGLKLIFKNKRQLEKWLYSLYNEGIYANKISKEK